MRPTATESAWMLDLDGVLVYEGDAIPGADTFIARLRETQTPFLVLTNNSMYTPRDLQARLHASGLDVPESAIWTSAIATVRFLHSQRPGGSAYVVGEAGLTIALEQIGYRVTDQDPDYVVLGETRTYNFEALTTAIRLVNRGSRLVATNLDVTGASPEGLFPGTGPVAALVTAATGVAAYSLGKPNPLMMREGLRALGSHSETTVMVGDRMDTDIVAGLEAGMRTVLVLTGVTQMADVEHHPYRPTRVVASLGDLAAEVAPALQAEQTE